MRLFKYFIALMLLISITACNDEDNLNNMKRHVNAFHENYNSGNYEANYKWLTKYSGMTVSLDQYERDFQYIKSKLGDFKESNIQNINFDQTTKDGRKLVRISFDSKFSNGIGKEFFYFGERNEFYRYELFSDNLLR
ncbi:hypothetical protein [Diaphorobacter aerolatus]|uniref:DUF4019 domain-containing protein n=1 Tax=Diaphorobacter aerolatus TaxID=1288495 RepID=A0A7H0GGF0_9BURK|nr:hypothetical protein [Diaphorobacter aerolatus]QNP47366.1 hypothetical protein H9K75_13570 [Diaphorobacter aerolatus]